MTAIEKHDYNDTTDNDLSLTSFTLSP